MKRAGKHPFCDLLTPTQIWKPTQVLRFVGNRFLGKPSRAPPWDFALYVLWAWCDFNIIKASHS